MSWICNRCGLNNVNLVLICYCRNERSEFEPFDSIDEIIYSERLRKLDEVLKKAEMTDKEELFKYLFNHEKSLVKDMDILTLRAHIEDLSKVAYEARARLTAALDEEKDRKKKSDNSKSPTGFQRSINVDDTATDAINAVKDRIKERKKRQPLNEKLIDNLMKVGYSREEAEKKLEAGQILGRLNKIKSSENEILGEKKLFNPFEKRE